MTLFLPSAGNIADRDVPVCCPQCSFAETRDGLTDAEKQFLIDATCYHEMLTEYRHLLVVKSIIEQHPGTRHPLLVGKLSRDREGFADEGKVHSLLIAQPDLCQWLANHIFRFDRRFPFVAEFVHEHESDVASRLVMCPSCEGQYLVLPDDYYRTIGFHQSPQNPSGDEPAGGGTP